MGLVVVSYLQCITQEIVDGISAFVRALDSLTTPVTDPDDSEGHRTVPLPASSAYNYYYIS